jgi:hypothetical protein
VYEKLVTKTEINIVEVANSLVLPLILGVGKQVISKRPGT